MMLWQLYNGSIENPVKFSSSVSLNINKWITPTKMISKFIRTNQRRININAKSTTKTALSALLSVQMRGNTGRKKPIPHTHDAFVHSNIKTFFVSQLQTLKLLADNSHLPGHLGWFLAAEQEKCARGGLSCVAGMKHVLQTFLEKTNIKRANIA